MTGSGLDAAEIKPLKTCKLVRRSSPEGGRSGTIACYPTFNRWRPPSSLAEPEPPSYGSPCFNPRKVLSARWPRLWRRLLPHSCWPLQRSSWGLAATWFSGLDRRAGKRARVRDGMRSLPVGLSLWSRFSWRSSGSLRSGTWVAGPCRNKKARGATRALVETDVFTSG